MEINRISPFVWPIGLSPPRQKSCKTIGGGYKKMGNLISCHRDSCIAVATSVGCHRPKFTTPSQTPIVTRKAQPKLFASVPSRSRSVPTFGYRKID